MINIIILNKQIKYCIKIFLNGDQIIIIKIILK